MRNWQKRFAVWTMVGLLAVVGCGRSQFETVEGKVTLDGKPLSGVHVNFYPKGADVNDARVFHGVTDAEGRFALRSPADNQTGVPVGDYRVALTTAVAGPNDDERTPLPPERIPMKFRENALTVAAGGTKEANFDLKSK
jgi:hypothetical protein